MSILSFKNVHVSQDGIPTLQDVSVELNPGDFVYLIGKSGSGKSTFFKSIFAELPIDSGQASVAGYSLNDINKFFDQIFLETVPLPINNSHQRPWTPFESK